MEFIGRGLSKQLWERGWVRKLHRAASSSVARERDADGTKRGGSFEAGFRSADDHQQFFIAAYCAIERAGGSHGDGCRDADGNSRFESEQRDGVVLEWTRMRRGFVRNDQRDDSTNAKRKRCDGVSAIHGAADGTEPEQRDHHGDAAGRSIQKSTGHALDCAGN